MSRANDAAIPIPFSSEAGAYNASPGMTIREYYAGLAMQGILSNVSVIDNCDNTSLAWAVDKAVIVSDLLIKRLGESK